MGVTRMLYQVEEWEWRMERKEGGGWGGEGGSMALGVYAGMGSLYITIHAIQGRG